MRVVDNDCLGFTSKRSKKTTLSVIIDNKTIFDKNAANTFVELINHISGIAGKENLYNDFPKIFNKSEFFWKKNNNKVQQTKDDSGSYFIFTNTSTENKKNLLEIIFRKYNIDIEVSIINYNIEDTETIKDTESAKDAIVDDIKDIFQNCGNIPMTSKEIVIRLEKRRKENSIVDLLSKSKLFDKTTTDKTRYRLSNYLPTKLVDSIKSYDFVTIDMLIEILGKNGININI